MPLAVFHPAFVLGSIGYLIMHKLIKAVGRLGVIYALTR